MIGSTIGLKAVNANFLRGMQVPARVGECPRLMAATALGFAAEKDAPAFGSLLVVTAGRGHRCGNRELVKMESRELGADHIVVAVHMTKMVFRGNGKLFCVIQPRIIEISLAVHLQVSNERIPVR